MSESKRKVFTGTQKAKIAIEAIKGTKTINENGVHPTQVNQWKKELLENAGSLFEGKRGPKVVNAQCSIRHAVFLVHAISASAIRKGFKGLSNLFNQRRLAWDFYLFQG